MQDFRYIQYYDNTYGHLLKIEFSEVFSIWMNTYGSHKQFVELFSNASAEEKLMTPAMFTTFFQKDYNARIANDVDQDFLYDPSFYESYIDNIVRKLDNAPLGKNSRQSIITMVILGTIVIWLISMCD